MAKGRIVVLSPSRRWINSSDLDYIYNTVHRIHPHHHTTCNIRNNRPYLCMRRDLKQLQSVQLDCKEDDWDRVIMVKTTG